jgi:phenylacetate-coenzyme A ligase PaaK-like adenylate-forming protein
MSSVSQLNYISGGTTGTPKIISYSEERYLQSISVKSKILAKCGIGEASRVIVMHPMAPWAIGEVFTDGALSIGASVLPVGINLQTETLSQLLVLFKPTVICAAGRNLLRVLGALPAEVMVELQQAVSLVLTAGERLEEIVAQEISNKLSCTVRDIYGCAELDALGVAPASGDGLTLVPDYKYKIRIDGEVREPRPGLRGVLVVQHPTKVGVWHSTEDVVEVLTPDRESDEWDAPRIRILERADIRIKFLDGCAIGGAQLSAAQRSLGLQAVQLVVDRSGSSDRVTLLYLVPTNTAISPAQVQHALLSVCTDFSDALTAGCIEHFAAVPIYKSEDFYETDRGKIPLIFARDASQISRGEHLRPKQT